MTIITRLEEAILIAVWRLKDDAYGVTINKQVSKSTRKNYSMGALYFALDQLQRKGHVSKVIKRFYHEKGGRSRTYYSLTEEGGHALREVRIYQKSLWRGISENVFESKNEK
jgi:DNA-binding PadR family transcriptional regulator